MKQFTGQRFGARSCRESCNPTLSGVSDHSARPLGSEGEVLEGHRNILSADCKVLHVVMKTTFRYVRFPKQPTFTTHL
jgi:hypothetical protein